MTPKQYIPTICQQEFGYLVAEYGFSMRRCICCGIGVVFRSKRTWVRIEFEDRDDMFFLHIAPIVFGVPVIWRRVDLASVIALGGGSFDQPMPGMLEVPGPRSARRSAEYVAQQLRIHADDMLQGDFSRLQEALACHRRSIERQMHEWAQRDRKDVELRRGEIRRRRHKE